MEDYDNPIIVEGLAVMAQTIFEMGGSEFRASETLVQNWTRLGGSPGVFLAAARAISQVPQPREGSAAMTERSLPARTLLGVTSAEDSLVAALRARETLEQLSRELG